MDFQKLKCVKERSARIENEVRKQNDYQERRLNKYIVGIEKEHQGNMTMIKSHQNELQKKSDKLQEDLKSVEKYVMPELDEAKIDVSGGLPLLQAGGKIPLYGERREYFKEHRPRQKRNRSKAANMWYKTTPVVIAAIRMLQRHGCNLSAADQAVLKENSEYLEDSTQLKERSKSQKRSESAELEEIQNKPQESVESAAEPRSGRNKLQEPIRPRYTVTPRTGLRSRENIKLPPLPETCS